MHTLAPCCRLWQIVPNLLRREAHDGSQQAHQGLADSPDRGLRASPGLRFRRENVKPVLEHIEIERAQVDDAEVVYPVIDLVKCEFHIPALNIRCEGLSLAQHVLVECFHFLEWNRIL